MANHVQHPRNVYVAERDIVPALDNWLLKVFASHRLTETIRRLHATQHAAALARRDAATAAQAQASHRLTEDDIRRLVGSFDDLRTTLRDARSEDKSTEPFPT
ncbi:hypothetical protein AB0H28_04305 [Micromonospora sp. NPDC050980]|uniref:hypothetical protein n=1 Tax=Micromonospora sp. NPDC050980 TaxID=3155161 RepID=UPI00340EAC18